MSDLVVASLPTADDNEDSFCDRILCIHNADLTSIKITIIISITDAKDANFACENVQYKVEFEPWLRNAFLGGLSHGSGPHFLRGLSHSSGAPFLRV